MKLQCSICRLPHHESKCPLLPLLKEASPKVKEHFSGSSPPEIFVGRAGYPEVYTGILAPQEYGKTEIYSMPELWHQQNASLHEIISYRSRMVYSRFKANIKEKKRLIEGMQEIALASKSVSTEFFLKKKPAIKINLSTHTQIIGNPALLQFLRLEENPKIDKKVDYLVNDTEVKSSLAMQELYQAGIPVSSIIKILSAGMLGIKSNRKLVPTRWSITAADDTISKSLLKKIRLHPSVNEYQVFSGEYIGNHYEILFIPRKWSYEVIEAKTPGSVINHANTVHFWQDYESFFPRKKYADDVTGGYYAPRLAIAEHLSKERRQASVLIFREVKPEYAFPCGVGILRETCRAALKNKPKKFNTIKEALADIQARITIPLKNFTEKSQLLKEMREQPTLNQFMQ